MRQRDVAIKIGWNEEEQKRKERERENNLQQQNMRSKWEKSE